MAEGRFVAYYRVSTAKQGRSGLRLDGQKAAVLAYLNGGSWALSGEFTEVESGKRDDNRPQLARALDACRLIGGTLLIAKLDRLSRNMAFTANLMESKVPFLCCDNPHATNFTIHILAAVAEHEAKQISARTISALKAAKERGTALGGYKGGPVPDYRAGIVAKRAKAEMFATRVRPTIAEMQAEGMSLHQVAASLSERGILTAQGGIWTATAVRRVLARAA